jgi:hypothetical protein
MNTIPIEISELEFGDFVSFSYKNKTRYVLVVAPEEKSKLMGFVIENNLDSQIAQYFLVFESKSDYDTAKDTFGNNNFRSYLVEEISNLQLVIPVTTQNVKFTLPNLQYEWKEAERYPEWIAAGKAAWMVAASNGKVAKLSTLVSNVNMLTNFDIDFYSLNEDKINRFFSAMRKREIEIPILLRFPDAPLEVLGGNTRISGCVHFKIDPTVLVVDVPIVNKEKSNE